MEDLQKDKSELEKLLGQAERTYVKKLLQNEIKKVDAYIADQATKDEEHKKLQERKGETEHEKLYSRIDKYGWGDEGKTVKIYVTSLDGIKDVPTDKITCDFTKRSFDLKIHGYKGRDVRLHITELNKDIDPEKSKFSIKSNSISITLRKVKEDSKWTGLKEGESSGPGLGGGMPGMGMPGMGGMGMPGMGGMGMEGMEGMEGMPDMGAMGGEEGGAPGMGGGEQSANMMEMMKKMYEEGDENTKKMMTEAMMKGGQDQQQ